MESRLLMRYEFYLMHEKEVSENTCSNYLRDLRQLQGYLDGNQLGSMEEVSTQVIETYIDVLDKSGKSKASIARFLAVIKGFFQYLKDKGMRQDNPAMGIRVAAPDHKAPTILTVEEMDRLLQAPKCVDAKGYRDRSMFSLLYATGMRVSELLALDIMDLDLFGGYVRCGTGEKLRVLPLYQEAVAVLSQYVGGARPTIITDVSQEALFVNMNGRRMSRQGFWKLIKSYQAEAGIETELTPHILRHSFAVHLLAHGAEVGAVQQMLGHAHVHSTLAYSQLANAHMCDVYQKTHPKA